MWDGFFGDIVKNINTGLAGAFTALTTSPQPAPPPPQVKTSQEKLVNKDLVATALARIPSAVDPVIAQVFNNAEEEKMKLFSDLIAHPYDYPELSERNKILFTQYVIKDLIGLHKPDQTNKNKNPINSIISRISVSGNNSFINESEAIVISDYYVNLRATKKREIPLATETTPTFQCQRNANSHSQNERAGGDTTGRRSKSTPAPPPVLFPYSREKKNRTPAKLQKSQEMHAEMQKHIESERRKESNHPAGLRPRTNSSQQNQSQTPLTSQGARDTTLTRGIRPTGYQSGDATKAKEQNLENIGKKLAKLEFELSRTKIRKGNLNIVKYRPGYGSYNQRRSEEYRDEGSNIKKDIETLNESLLNNYDLNDIKKVYTSKNTELQRLKNTPSLSPSAPLVATQPSRGHLPRT